MFPCYSVHGDPRRQHGDCLQMVRAVARQLQDRTRRGRDREGGAEQAETDGTSTTREIQHSWSSTAQVNTLFLYNLPSSFHSGANDFIF